MDHETKAVQYFEKGYICSQAVFAAFAEQFGITENRLCRSAPASAAV